MLHSIVERVRALELKEFWVQILTWSKWHLTVTLRHYFTSLFFKDFYLFIFRERGKEEEKERSINVWLPLTHPLLGTWPATQACALTGNRTNDPLVCRPALNPLSHMSQGYFTSLNLSFPICEMVIKIITYVGDIFNCHPIVATASFLVP